MNINHLRAALFAALLIISIFTAAQNPASIPTTHNEATVVQLQAAMAAGRFSLPGAR